jgi:UDP-N-acetylglucosamine--N-acetylmuramyl-(pentapeptide) pyrophosphoryl-undecaprenol N-acetylglucosamine transferase
MRVVLTGGGSAGHVIPFEPIIEALRTQFLREKSSLPGQLDPDELELTFIGVADQPARQLFKKYDLPVISILSGKLRRYVSWKNPTDLFFRLPFGILQALIHVWRIMPDVVISKGGYGSLPVTLAAILYRIPILLHESDVAPGAANALLIRFATAITVSFETTKEYLGSWQHKAYTTGTPVRSQLTTISQVEGKRTFDIPADEPTLLVVGGSQGAQQLNEMLLKILPELIVDMAIIHVTGRNHYQTVSAVAQEMLMHSPRQQLYKPYPYLTDTMPAALAAADGIASRAGSIMAEIARLRKPTLLIPLDSAANDHQRKNAQAYEAAGAALVLDPNNLGENIVKQNIRRIMADTSLRRILKNNLAHVDFPHAARDIAQLALKLAQGFAPRSTSNQHHV